MAFLLHRNGFRPSCRPPSRPLQRHVVMIAISSFIVVVTCLFVPVEGYNSKQHVVLHLNNNNKSSNNNNNSRKKQRELRGGYYGGGGRYNSGGSSSWGGSSNNRSNNNRYNNNNNNNNRRRSSGMGSRIARTVGFMAAGLIGLALLGMLFPALGIGSCLSSLLCCCGLAAGTAAAGAAAAGAVNGNGYYKEDSHNDDNMYNAFSSNNNGGGGGGGNYNNEMFEENVQRAKLEVDAARSYMSTTTPTIPPYSGEYITSYVDGGIARSATLTLHFTIDATTNNNNNTGYKLSGSGKDIDGSTVIEDGRVNYDGTAWWRERTVTGDVGLQVLSRGKFDFEKRVMDGGNWFASSGQGGSYLSFRVNPNVTAANVSSSTTSGGGTGTGAGGAVLGMNAFNNAAVAEAPPVVVTGTIINEPNVQQTAPSSSSSSAPLPPPPYVPTSTSTVDNTVVTASAVPVPYVPPAFGSSNTTTTTPVVTVVAEPVKHST